MGSRAIELESLRVERLARAKHDEATLTTRATFLHPQDLLWWAKGGALYGESAPRLALLRRILEEGPSGGLEPVQRGKVIPYGFPCAGQEHQYYLTYFGVHRPAQMRLEVPEGEEYAAEIVDTWAMTVTPVLEPVVRGVWVQLPQSPYQALILRRIP